MKSDCKFCVASAPLYRRFAEEARTSKTTNLLFVAPPGDVNAKTFLAEHGIELAPLSQSLIDLRFRATPTVVLIDASSRVAGVWEGQLPENVAAQVLNDVF